MVFDQGEGSDILDAIVAEGRCGTCGTPWDRVVNVDGKRPVKIDGGCPNEVCVLGDWVSSAPEQCPPRLELEEGRSVLDSDTDARTECASTSAEGLRHQGV
jgi:hypothetical protein